MRIGNGAWNQKQHDVWGALLDSIYLHTKSRDNLPESVWPIVVRAVEKAIEHWRGARPRHLGGARRAQALHLLEDLLLGGVRPRRAAGAAARGHRARGALAGGRRRDPRATICENGVDERGVFTQHYDTDALDASLLLMPLLRFLPADDERVAATVEAIEEELTVDGLVLRYKVDETDDGLSGEEGTFAICSFWLVSALSEIGETGKARELCEKMLSYASPLLPLRGGDRPAQSGRHLGNFPQAFTHLALINAVMHVIRADHELMLATQPLDASRRESGAEADHGRRPGRGAACAEVLAAPAARGAARRAAWPTSRSTAARRRGRSTSGCPALLDDWSGVHLWFGDERCVPPDDEESNFRLAAETLIAGARHRAPTRVHRMRGELGPDEGARAYAAELAEHLELDDAGIPVLDVVAPRPRARRPHRLAVPRPRRAARSAAGRRSASTTRPSRRPSASRCRWPASTPRGGRVLHTVGEGKREAAVPRAGRPATWHAGVAAASARTSDDRRRRRIPSEAGDVGTGWSCAILWRCTCPGSSTATTSRTTAAWSGRPGARPTATTRWSARPPTAARRIDLAPRPAARHRPARRQHAGHGRHRGAAASCARRCPTRRSSR